jgi:predicted transcriptional regulator
MGTPIVTNTEIEITSVYFRTNSSKQRFESYPKRMVYEGREYTFVESGMHYLVRKGQDLIKLFDVRDENTLYRLRLDSKNQWTLVNMRALA